MTKELYNKIMSILPKDIKPEYIFDNLVRVDTGQDDNVTWYDETTELITSIRINKSNFQDELPFILLEAPLENLQFMNIPITYNQFADVFDKIPGVLIGGLVASEAKDKMIKSGILTSRSATGSVEPITDRPVPRVTLGNKKTSDVKDPYKNINNRYYHPPTKNN